LIDDKESFVCCVVLPPKESADLAEATMEFPLLRLDSIVASAGEAKVLVTETVTSAVAL
jgi:hypothetical protein